MPSRANQSIHTDNESRDSDQPRYTPVNPNQVRQVPSGLRRYTISLDHLARGAHHRQLVNNQLAVDRPLDIHPRVQRPTLRSDDDYDSEEDKKEEIDRAVAAAPIEQVPAGPDVDVEAAVNAVATRADETPARPDADVANGPTIVDAPPQMLSDDEHGFPLYEGITFGPRRRAHSWSWYATPPPSLEVQTEAPAAETAPPAAATTPVDPTSPPSTEPVNTTQSTPAASDVGQPMDAVTRQISHSTEFDSVSSYPNRPNTPLDDDDAWSYEHVESKDTVETADHADGSDDDLHSSSALASAQAVQPDGAGDDDRSPTQPDLLADSPIRDETQLLEADLPGGASGVDNDITSPQRSFTEETAPVTAAGPVLGGLTIDISTPQHLAHVPAPRATATAIDSRGPTPALALSTAGLTRSGHSDISAQTPASAADSVTAGPAQKGDDEGSKGDDSTGSQAATDASLNIRPQHELFCVTTERVAASPQTRTEDVSPRTHADQDVQWPAPPARDANGNLTSPPTIFVDRDAGAAGDDAHPETDDSTPARPGLHHRLSIPVALFADNNSPARSRTTSTESVTSTKSDDQTLVTSRPSRKFGRTRRPSAKPNQNVVPSPGRK